MAVAEERVGKWNPEIVENLVQLDELYEDPDNARAHDVRNIEAIKSSYSDHGQQKAIVVMDDGRVIAGNGSLKAVTELGWTHIAVTRFDGDTRGARQFGLSDNRTSDLSDWNEDVLVDQLKDLQELDVDLSGIGWNQAELEKLFSETIDATRNPDELPEPPKKAHTKLGDLWVCGNHRVLCGDATDPSTLSRVCDGAQPDLLFTDPPYGISIVSNDGRTGVSKKAKAATYEPVYGDDAPFDPTHLFGLAASSIIWGANYFPRELPRRGQWIVWDKRRPDGTTYSDCELAWTTGDGVSVKKYSCTWNGMVKEGESASRVHPTQKPIKLFCDVLADWPGALVLDPYLGSGTTLIACEQLGRSCCGVEISPLYVDVIVKRIEEFSGKKAKRIKA